MTAETFGIIAPHPPIFVPAVGGAEAHVAQASLDALASRARRARRPSIPTPSSSCRRTRPPLPTRCSSTEARDFAGTLGAVRRPDAATRGPATPSSRRRCSRELAAHGIDAVRARRTTRGCAPGWLDHGTIVPLSFLDPSQRAPPRRPVALVPAACRRTARSGSAVREAAERLGRRVAFVASGDCSHRLTPDAPAGYSPRGAEFDAWLRETVERGDLSELVDVDERLDEAAGECGLRSFIALGGFAGDDPVPTRVLAYEGPWGVGYLTALVGDAALAAGRRAGLARAAQRAQGRHGGRRTSPRSSRSRAARSRPTCATAPSSTPEAARRAPSTPRAPARSSRCTATATCAAASARSRRPPTRSPRRSSHNAIEAATRDPRFPPLARDELADLDIKVDVLHAPEVVHARRPRPGALRRDRLERAGAAGCCCPTSRASTTSRPRSASRCARRGIAPGERVRARALQGRPLHLAHDLTCRFRSTRASSPSSARRPSARPRWPRSSRSGSAARSSAPTRCRSTAAWTSAPRSRRRRERRVPVPLPRPRRPGRAVLGGALPARGARAPSTTSPAADALPVVAGGTGLYVRAALDGWSSRAASRPTIPRASATSASPPRTGAEALHALLAQRDPASAALIHPNNIRRVDPRARDGRRGRLLRRAGRGVLGAAERLRRALRRAHDGARGALRAHRRARRRDDRGGAARRGANGCSRPGCATR